MVHPGNPPLSILIFCTQGHLKMDVSYGRRLERPELQEDTLGHTYNITRRRRSGSTLSSCHQISPGKGYTT